MTSSDNILRYRDDDDDDDVDDDDDNDEDDDDDDADFMMTMATVMKHYVKINVKYFFIFFLL